MRGVIIDLTDRQMGKPSMVAEVLPMDEFANGNVVRFSTEEYQMEA